MLQQLSHHHGSRFSGIQTPVQAFRQKKMNAAIVDGMPSRKLESWHYTPQAMLASVIAEATLSSPLLTSLEEVNKYRCGDVFIFVIENGRLRLDLSDKLPYVLSLNEILKTRFDEVEGWISKVPKSLRADPNMFEDLNTAYLDEGLLIDVPANAKLEKPIQILNINSSAKPIATFLKIFIRLGQSAEARVLETHIGATGALSSVFTYGDLFDGSQLEYSRFSNSEQVQVDEGNFVLNKHSKLNAINLVLSPKLNRHSLNVFLMSDSAEANLSGLSVLNEKQVTDNQVNIEHLAPNCRSRQLYKGVLSGQSKAIFSGRIYIAQGSNGTDSAQLNKNLILSRQAEADIKPQLEVYADDVKATHGAAIGRFDPEELFYLQSRGIPKDESLKMLANAFVDDVLVLIKDKQIRETLRSGFLESFAQLEIEGQHGS